MYDVQAQTCLEAWKLGTQKICEARGEIFNLITQIDNPATLMSSWISDYSPHVSAVSNERVSDVIDTIFPLSLAHKYPVRADLYSNYMILHRRAMRWRRNRSRWGTYFERLIAFGDLEQINQLERVILKLNSWSLRNTTGLVFHLSSPIIDSPRTRGGPCWHFGEILWHADNSIDLVVVYRNHDFFDKALGNFIGLGQLLKFIADASGKNVGKLICHSIHAYSGKSMRDLKTFAQIGSI